jgi:hypothetical protein
VVFPHPLVVHAVVVDLRVDVPLVVEQVLFPIPQGLMLPAIPLSFSSLLPPGLNRRSSGLPRCCAEHS